MSRAWTALINLFSWARVVRGKATAGKVATVQTTAHKDDEHQHWQAYGFQARPKPGATAVLAAMGAHAGQQIALLVGDARYTIALEEGEVAIVDDLGQKVHLTRSGIVIDSDSIKLGAAASAGVARLGDTVTLNPALALWLNAVATAAYLPATPPVVIDGPGGPPSTGTITTASTTVLAE